MRLHADLLTFKIDMVEGYEVPDYDFGDLDEEPKAK
jgi:hypothetical protein